MMQVNRFEAICPPWALPRENIPIHVKIEKSTTPKIKDIVIEIPHTLVLQDQINISESYYDGNRLTIRRCEHATGSDFDYFGFVVASTDLQQEVQKHVPIRLVVQYLDGTSMEQVITVKIFRPMLKFDSVPDKITITDGGLGGGLPVGLRFSGFGNIIINAECSINGKLVSIDNSLLDNVLNNIYNAAPGILDSDLTAKPDIGRARLLSSELRSLIESGDAKRIVVGGVTKEEKDLMLASLSMNEREKILNVFYDTLGDYLIKYIHDIIEKNPGNNVKLASQTKIHARLGMDVTHLELKITYADSLRNTYPPLQKNIQIVNQRKKSPTNITEIPLVLSVDETSAYSN